MGRWFLLAAIAFALTAACGRAWYDPIDPGGESGADGGDPSRTGDAGGGEGSDAGVLTTGSAAADTSLSASEPGANFGALDVLRTAGSPGATILIRFELGIVPADVAVQSLTLAVSTSGAAQDPSSVRIYRVFEDWTEGDESGAPGEASWELRAPGIAWTRAGCGVGSRDAAARGLSPWLAAGAPAWLALGAADRGSLACRYAGAGRLGRLSASDAGLVAAARRMAKDVMAVALEERVSCAANAAAFCCSSSFCCC